ncbi:MAG: CBS domain-containing protein [Desulfobulbus sp.]
MQRYWTDQGTPLTAIASHRLQSLSPDDTLLAAVRLIVRTRLSSLLVLDDQRHPLGIITERILLGALHANREAQTPLREIMAKPVIVGEGLSCREAYQVCLRRNVHHLVLVDGQKRALAVVSETDFHRHLDLQAPAAQVRVGSVMRRPLCALKPDTPLQQALKHMHDRFAEAIVAVEQQRPVGILSQRDLARLFLYPPEQRQRRFGEVMTSPIRTVAVDTTLAEAATGMLDHNIRNYPVVDCSGVLVGLVSSHDLVQAMAFGLTGGPVEEEETSIDHTLLEQAPFPLFVSTLEEGRFCFLNARAEEKFHIRREEMLGQPVEQFYTNPEARQQLLELLRREGKAHDLRLSFINAKGRVFEALVSSTLINYQHHRALLTAINDITEQLQVTGNLQRERAKLHALLQGIPDLLCVKDSQGRYLVCNPVCEQFFGARQEDITGKTDHDLLPGEMADCFRASDLQTMATGKPTISESWLSFAEGKRQRLFEAVKTPIKNEDGSLIGVLCIARDITERRREQRDLRERVKEQQCLYRVFALTEDVHGSFAEQLQQVVEQIPPGWQYPEITAARIRHG